MVTLRVWAVTAGLLFAMWQAVQQPLPEPGLVVGARRPL